MKTKKRNIAVIRRKTATLGILILMLGAWSCNNPSTTKSAQEAVDTAKDALPDSPKEKIYIADKSLYDNAFVTVISTYPAALKLIDDHVIIGGDTTYFPTILELDREITFQGKNNNYSVLLTVTRINLTNLTYKFKLTGNNNKMIDTKSGTAIIGMFFLGDEIDIDLEKNEGYASTAYWDRSNDYLFSIRIGNETDNSGKIRAMVHYKYNDQSNRHLELQDCPTLITK